MISQEKAAALAAAVNEHSLAIVGTRRALVDEHGALRLARWVPPDAKWSLDAEGGAAYLTSKSPHVVHEIGVFGGSPKLLSWAEDEARAQLSCAPDGARVVIQTQALEADGITRRLLEKAAGYEHVRTWCHLEIELDNLPPEPAWPQGISMRPFDPEHDWPAVGAAMDEAFLDHWGALPVEGDVGDEDEDVGEEEDSDDDPYSNSRDFCFVAWSGEEVAGVLLGNERTVEWPDSGKVGSIAVRRPFRRRGLATALLLHALAAFRRHGIRRVITDTDSESFTAGPVLYVRLGMRAFRRELVLERELRPGEELRATQGRGE